MPAASVDAAEDAGKRPITAMDDFMQCMKYAEKVVKAGPLTKPCVFGCS